MARVWNFSAGPSTLPEQVLQTAAAEMMDYRGSGQSVMERSHRSKTFDKIIKDAEALMRELYQVPDNYKVLFLQGGASSQFAMVPAAARRTISSPASGPRKPIRRLRSTAMCRPWPPLRTKPLAIFPRPQPPISGTMRTMCIFV